MTTPDLPAQISTSSTEETFALGLGLATLLKQGSVVALSGPLGSGKTYLAKGIARGLGVEEEVSSPSYTVVSEYEALIAGEKTPVYHIDAYRLKGNDDFSAIGGEEIVFGKGISLIEWAERIEAFISDDALKINIEIIEDDKRFFHIFWANKASKEERK